MKILLLGATGRTGRLVLQQALSSGFEVNCLARNSTRIQKRIGLEIFEGNPTKAADIERAIQGCDAIISVLNISRTSDFPWAPLRTPKTFLSETMSSLISTARKMNVRRIAICSAWGVAETREDIPLWFKWLIEKSNIGVAYRDHERQEQILSVTNLDWTIVRPVGLTNTRKDQEVLELFGGNDKPKLLISRKTVANFLLKSLKRNELIGKKVVISKT
ncbi:Putative NADH-flavin reductase [Robiginitalea myxolifaciens]|uniref:Putative NADH-flavin reductase n=1 Tax=Robiginitalea myxolifaciens TaxID=400055 RepID=A0A1I6HBZ9_9FLAO|nr:NAD(P)H-binding protein [Robiginitalea myxolifaciens]SFR51963.1 Putative NADH-flavin reductase [Robiginitalea myxolifaciens]